jgi:hypothetical protein
MVNLTLQDYIESENHRLEQEAFQFWAKEIVVKIEYKYCPNLTIIDTPGLIAAAPGKRNHQLQAQARAVEQLVLNKMKQREFIILCLEDCSDWSNATTRRVVMQVMPATGSRVASGLKQGNAEYCMSSSSSADHFPASRCLHF